MTATTVREPDLYERDFVRWTQAQAAELRRAARGSNLPLDWENLAEEIESLGRADRRDVGRQLSRIIVGLLGHSMLSDEAERDPRLAVIRARFDLQLVLDDSPSLRDQLPLLTVETYDRARRLVEIMREGSGLATPSSCPFSVDQLLDEDWLPAPPTDGSSA